MVRPIPVAAVETIRRFEGCKLTAYRDAGGIWTIGWGHTENICEGMAITAEQAEEFLREDLQKIGPTIIKNTTVTLNNNQYSALLSFVFNVGSGAFERSTLLKKINTIEDNDESSIVTEFVKWDKDARGVVLDGLLARRRAEASLYFTAT